MKVLKAEGPGHAEDVLLELLCAHDKTALVVVTDDQSVLARSPNGIEREMAQDVVFPVALLRRRGWTVACIHKRSLPVDPVVVERYRPDLLRRMVEAEQNAK